MVCDGSLGCAWQPQWRSLPLRSLLRTKFPVSSMSIPEHIRTEAFLQELTTPEKDTRDGKPERHLPSLQITLEGYARASPGLKPQRLTPIGRSVASPHSSLTAASGDMVSFW